MTFKIVKAEETDYQLFASVIQEVYEALEQKEWFAADNAEYTYHMLKDCNGVGYKAVHEPLGAVAGIFLVTFPGNSEENLGRDIGLSEEALSLVAQMDSVAILPQYRGAGLQKRLMQRRRAGTDGTGIPVFYVYGASGEPVQQAECHQSGI